MKIIITESQHELIRRYGILKELVDNGIDVLNQSADLCDYTFSDFLEEVCWQVSDNMDELNMDTETVGSIEKVHRWVRNNLGLYIREEFDRIIDEHNCNEGFDDADEDDLSSLMFGVDNIQESIEDDEYNFSLRNAIKRRYNDIIYEMEKYLHNEIDCNDWEENEFMEWILEKVTDEMMFNYGIDNWEWSDLNDELSNILKDRINSFYESWTTNNC
jgi:hypothetical protein